MKFKARIPQRCATESRAAGFTLVECLVALAFMALVVPVVVQGLRVAALAGEVSQRKAQAMRVAEKVLNETIVTGQWSQNSLGGNEQAGPIQYHWTVHNEPWSQLGNVVTISTSNGVNQSVVNPSTMHQLTVDVTFPAQSQMYAVHLTTLINFSQQVTIANLPPAQ